MTFPCRALGLDTSSSFLEKRIFDFFRNHTAPSMSGFFDDETWDCTALQLSHSEPAVRYAVNALAAVHEERLLRRAGLPTFATASCVTSTFPVQQYLKALKRLRVLLSSPDLSIDLVLTCALLCTYFEALRGSFRSALTHVENVANVLHSGRSSPLLKANQNLLATIVQLDVHGSMYCGSRAPTLSWLASGVNTLIPEAFENLTQARNIVSLWTCRMLHFFRTTADHYKFLYPGDVPIEVIWMSQQLEKAFLDLEGLLQVLKRNQPSENAVREKSALGVLEVQAKLNRIRVAACLYSEESIYDAFEEDFDYILSVCTSAIATKDADRRIASVLPDEGLIYPLQFVAIHCRDGSIRRQALEQLKKRLAIDYAWHTEALTSMAQMCIGIEESFCEKVPKSHDIPEWRRIHSSGFQIPEHSLTHQVKIRFTLRLNGMDGEWDSREKIITC